MWLGPSLVNGDNNIAKKQIKHITFLRALIVSMLQNVANLLLLSRMRQCVGTDISLVTRLRVRTIMGLIGFTQGISLGSSSHWVLEIQCGATQNAVLLTFYVLCFCQIFSGEIANAS